MKQLATGSMVQSLGLRTPVGETDFLVPISVQTTYGAQPICCTIGVGLFPECETAGARR